MYVCVKRISVCAKVEITEENRWWTKIRESHCALIISKDDVDDGSEPKGSCQQMDASTVDHQNHQTQAFINKSVKHWEVRTKFRHTGCHTPRIPGKSGGRGSSVRTSVQARKSSVFGQPKKGEWKRMWSGPEGGLVRLFDGSKAIAKLEVFRAIMAYEERKRERGVFVIEVRLSSKSWYVNFVIWNMSVLHWFIDEKQTITEKNDLTSMRW